MRTLLATTAVAALALAVPTAPANAVGTPGVGAVPLVATSFFRPTIGIVAVGSCTYAGAVLAAEAASVTVIPGSEISVSVSCTLHDAWGNVVGSVSGPTQRYATAGAVVVLPANTPVLICGSMSGSGSNWSHPATDSACAPVVPGQLT